MTSVSFNFGNFPVRTHLDLDGNVWWVAKDVCAVLGIVDQRQALERFPENERGVCTVHTPGGDQAQVTVSEPGLYRLIFSSRKKEAERFKTWVFREVLPSIRKTGSYSVPTPSNPPPPKRTLGAHSPPTPTHIMLNDHAVTLHFIRGEPFMWLDCDGFLAAIGFSDMLPLLGLNGVKRSDAASLPDGGHPTIHKKLALNPLFAAKYLAEAGTVESRAILLDVYGNKDSPSTKRERARLVSYISVSSSLFGPAGQL